MSWETIILCLFCWLDFGNIELINIIVILKLIFLLVFFFKLKNLLLDPTTKILVSSLMQLGILSIMIDSDLWTGP